MKLSNEAPPSLEISANSSPGMSAKNVEAIYRFSILDKIMGAVQGLRMRFLPRRILLAGPYVGEFGHELMDWQACIRACVSRYREVHVITYPGRAFLYPGCRVHVHRIPLEKAGYKHGRFTPGELDAIALAKAAELGLRNYDLLGIRHACTQYHRKFILTQKFALLAGKPLEGPSCDVAFHFRRIRKEGPDDSRNYPVEMCDELASLCLQEGLRVRCVGHPLYSHCPDGVEDCRSEDLAASVKMIASARILAGELSGPMHLAQLCATPILIWAPDQWRIDNCNRWNIFGVPTFVVANGTTRPSPKRVLKVINDSLRRLPASYQSST